MPPKSYKRSPWVACERCNCDITSNDIKSHLDSDCLSDNNEWACSYIKNGSLHASLEFFDDSVMSADVHKPRSEDIVYLSASAATLCNLVIGEPVILQKIENNVAPIVRRFWPTKSSNPAAVLITSKYLEHDTWCTKSRRVKISPLTNDIMEATNIKLQSENVSVTLQKQIVGLLQRRFAGNIINQHNRLVFYYFGRRLELMVHYICSSEKVSLCSEPYLHWFRLSDTTVWNFQSEELSKSAELSKKNIAVGGVDKIIEEIKELIDIALTDNPTISIITRIRGVLLYGLSGTGKTTICKYLAKITGCQYLSVDGSEVFSKYYGETENTIKKIFQNAIANAPTVLVVDQIDTICPKKVTAATDQERRVVSTFMSLLDSLHEFNSRVFVLATTNKIDTIDPSLRRFGRLDREIEIPVPDKFCRREILITLLEDVSHNLSYENINSISDVAHGFVGADLMNLCTQASMHCLSKNPTSPPKLDISDFTWGLSMVKPSAMREVLIEVPNVKWTDIGGQDDLKLKLKQAVEWPLKHPESFENLGIKPPNGVLMYGPPGCSKTMIAKALANESGLNFLSIKGPELFSKWVGESERAVRDLFRKARQVSPSIIFFDEIDALGGERSHGSGSANVHERVLAQILTELDGVVPLSNVTIVAATNRPDKIDKALLRPGRIDRMVYVALPDTNTRKEIFRIKMAKMRVAQDIDINELCVRTQGFSGAEVIAVCHEAALKALEENIECSEVQYIHFDLALMGISPRTPNSLLELYKSFSQNNRT